MKASSNLTSAVTNPPELTWSKPEQFPLLADGEVHVWRAALEEDESRVEKYFALLSPDEKARAARLVFANHRARFITARGILRYLLGQYSQTPPQDLTFEYSKHGKPALSTSHSLCFNLSHSENQAVYVFGLNGRLGIDLEKHDEHTEKLTIAKRFFSLNEAAALAQVPEDEMTSAFYRCWTRKEAFIKAIGAGLSCPLDAFEVTFLPGEPPALQRLDLPGEQREKWRLFDISPQNDFSAAVATDAAVMNLRAFNWRVPNDL
jgi:4'-phosphopantetheinyl transferase